MPEKRLKELLNELHQTLDSPGQVTDEERELLSTLAGDIRARLDSSGEEPSALTDQVGEAVEQFEQSHPRISYTLRGVLDALAKMGI